MKRADTRPAATIAAYPDGPLIVRGDVQIVTEDGDALETGPVVALCRCGRSGRRPLCDGTHRRAVGRPTKDRTEPQP